MEQLDDGFPVGTLVTQWSVISGPGTVEFSPTSATNSQPATIATFSQTGRYVLRLAADDSLLENDDEVVILVNAPPIVAMKSNVVVTVGESVLLEGSVSDDGIPSTNSLSVQWTPVNGIGVFELSNPTNAITTARFLEMGNYVLRLSANDSLTTSAADVTVRVLPINRAPVVDAGSRQLLMLSESAFLRGTVSDDGLPLEASLAFSWTKISGPGDVSFSNVHSTNTTATFSAAGDYVLRLEASDTALVGFADVKITVRTPAMNRAPVVCAGVNKVIGLTNIAFLDGVVTDDGLPQGETIAVNWTVVNGPGAATFENSSITNAKVSFASVGTYVLRLTANDSEYSASNDVAITVYPFNQPPVVNAGPDQNITIPDPSVLVPSGETPSGPNSELSVSLSETAHWDNAIGQPGLDDYILRNSLSVGDDLFVTGHFQHAGTNEAHGSARWNGAQWFSLYDPRPHLNDNYDYTKTNIGYFVYDCGGFPYCNQILDCVAARGQEAFVGGLGKNLAYSDSYKDMSARWSGTGWESWVFKQAGNQLWVIQATPNKVYLGGYFAIQPTNATDQVFTNLPWSYCIASWDGTNWGTFGSGIVDITDKPLTTDPRLNNYHAYVMSMVVASNGNVFVAGRFIMATPTGFATNIAEWNGREWEPLGGGLISGNPYLNGSGMAFGQNGDLYVGGNFTNAGGVSVRNIARWDGTRWWPLTFGTNNGVNGQIEAVAAHGRDIYVGGSFTEAGGVPAWRVAKWDGQFWRSLGIGTTNGSENGTFGGVYSLAVDDSGLYVGGMFSKAGGKPANNIAKWVFPKQPTKVARLQGRVTDDELPVNSVLNAEWNKVSGPGEVVFANATNPVTRASFSQPGAYVLRLTANDSEFTALDEVTINVRGNLPPFVDAGTDRAIGISESTVLQATISDDDFPVGANHACVWSVAGGPGVVTFDNPTGTNTTVHFSQQGTYVLRFSANDSQFTAFDDVTVTVLGDNQAPYGQPGNLSRTVSFGAPISFIPSQLRDDGQPLHVTNVLWSQISGPGIVSFSNPTNATTTATFSLPGVYVVRFDVNDSELNSFVDVTVTVTTPVNYSPTVYAGPSQSVSNLTALLQGTVSDDGLPVGGSLNVYWTKNSGPGTVTFANSNSPVTYVTFSKPGSYVLTLTANDSQYSQTSSLTVSMPNQAPVANAGPDRTIVWPTKTLLLTGSAMDDAQYYAPMATWQKMSGPGIVSFSSSSSFTNTATFSTSGVYVLRLYASDGGWSGIDDITVTVSTASNQPPIVDAGIDIFLTWPSNTVALEGALTDDGQPLATTWAHWTKFSGPGDVTFSQSTFVDARPATTATFSQPGTYILRLTGSDSALTNGDDVTVSINLPSNNQPPVVDAGQDQTITVTNTLELAGVVTDDGNPYGSTLSSSWKKISGSGPVYFAGGRTNFTTNLVTTATFLIPGTYVLRLTGSDSATNAGDDVVVVVLRDDPNQVPVVSCGPDLTLTQYEPHSLNASVSDDGLPFDGFIATAWSKISGPGTVFFGNVNVTNSSVMFYATGTYVLRLTATDGRTTAYDDLTVTVVPPVNDAPFAYAGGNLTVVRPDAAVLEAAVFDDSFPRGYPLTFAWAKVSGPGNVTFTPASGIVTNDYFNTLASFSAPGEYVLRLTADDSEFTDYDEIAVTVFPGTNSAPVVNAGLDRSVYVGSLAILTTDVSDDGLENGFLQISWSQVSGPGLVSFSSINGIYRANFAAPGDYVLRLTANDGALSASDDVALTVYDVPAPIAEIDSPTDSSIITAPKPIVGTASSAILQSYVIEYRLKPAEDPSTEIVRETEGWSVLSSNSVSVVSNTLAVFDPTLLLNGIYELRLTVTDLAERVSTTEPITVIVDRNLKVGHFAVSFNDLAVPVPGLPIQITRTYDSRAAAAGIQGDFGIGWTMDIRNVRLQKNRSLAANWEETTTGSPWDLSLAYHLNPGRARVVTITFPDGRVEKFRLDPNPLDRALWPIDYPQWRFTPLGNTRGTLVPSTYDQPDGNFLYFSGSIPGTADLYDLNAYYDWINFDLTDAELSRYPTTFRYASQEGYKYIIDEIAGLQSVTDPNGNTLVIGTNNITWQNTSAGTNKLSIYFQRDVQGRITNIVDAAGHAMTYAYGTNGNLLTFVDRVGQTNGFAYTNSAFPHHLTGIIDARGVMPVRNEYEVDGRLIGNVDALGGAIGYTHAIADNREYVTNRLGQVTINEYDEHGNVTRSIDPMGGVTLSSYDENGNLLQTVDPLGRTNTYTYDAVDNRLTATDPLGNTTRFTYGAQRRVTSVVDPRGNTITNVFDANGNLLSMRDPLGNVTRFGYDAQGLPVAMTNTLGQVMRFNYDAQGRLASETDALGHSTSYQRDSNGNLLVQSSTRTTSNGTEVLAVQFQYDAQGRLTNSIFPDGSSTRTLYNSIAKPSVTIDQQGRATLLDYDELGRVTRTTYPDGSSESSAYDAEGRRIASTNRVGQVTRFDYDANGRLFRTMMPDGTSNSNYFDLAGQLRASSDARGNSTFYGYDAAGRSVAVTNALGQVSLSFYDAAGNLTNAVDALGRSTRFVYDQLNRRVQTIFTDGTTQTTWFDALGRRTHEQDQAGKVTAFGYDELGRMTAVTNALGYVTSYAYDELGQQISQTDANNHTTTFEYDSLGRRVKRTLPGGQIETYAYNIGGLLTNKTDFNGYVTTYQYDLMNRLLAKVPDPRRGEPAVTFGYNTLGLRTNMTDASGATSYSYDERNRLVQKTKSWAATSFSLSLSYGYDANGNVTNIVSSNPNGSDVSYEYDALNRLSAVNDAKVGRTAYSYDDVGNLQGYTYPNGVHSAYEYDSLNRLTNLASTKLLTPIAQYAYTVGASGNRLTAAETFSGSAMNSHPSTINRIYAYDDIYRLTSESIGGTSYTSSTTLNYSYDPVGNRLSRGVANLPLLPQSFTFDANDRLNSDSYDANGNTLFATGFNQTQPDRYDSENRLIIRQTPTNTVEIKYDGDGNRVSKKITSGGTTTITYYVVDELNPSGYAQVLEEHTSINYQPPGIHRVYTYGHSLISQDRLDNASWATSFYGYDGHNSVHYLTDPNGFVTDTYDYDAFGNLIARTGDTPNDYLFTGEQYDSDLGLYYLRARYHNADTGRFWTQDSFEGFGSDPASLHKYTYCANNPVNCYDPSGHITLGEIGTAAAIGAGTTVAVNAIASAVYAKMYGLAFGEMYGLGDLASDATEGAVYGVAGLGIGKGIGVAAKWMIGRFAPFLMECGPWKALVAYVQESTKLNNAYALARQTWQALDNAVIQGSEAAMNNARSALAETTRQIIRLSGRAYGLASELGMDAAGNVYRDIAALATRNGSAAEVVLGKYGDGGASSYISVAKSRGAAYFSLGDLWNDVGAAFGEGNLTVINKWFLRQQLDAGKRFVLSHDPALATGSFADEVRFLAQEGFQFVKDGQIWRAVR
jgi:RHS repeat-associated protein